MARRLLHRPEHTETSPRAAGRRSVFVRHVDGGSSNAVELELTSLTGPTYDLAQYGIRFVASPRHADVLLLTGPLTRNMLEPLRQAAAVMPEPRAIVTAGDFAGLLSDSYATVELPDELRRAVVAHVPGDPPEPWQLIEAVCALTRPAER